MDSTRAPSPRAEFVVGMIILAVGVFLLISAESIPVSGEDDFGARSLPRTISALIIAMGALWAAISFRKLRKTEGPAGPDPKNRFLYTRIVPLMVSSFLYAILFQWFGYVVSTFIIMVPVLYIYGNQRVFPLLGIAVFGTAVYYLLFIKLMGIFDAGGSVINFNEMLGL